MKEIQAKGHVVFITQVNPYTPVGGVTVVMRNMLKGYDKSSYTIGYLGRFSRKLNRNRSQNNDVFRLIPNFHPVQFLGILWPKLKTRYAIGRGVALVKKKKATALVGLYPTLASIEVSERVAYKAGIPFYPYLHDTIKEGLSNSPFAERAAMVQDRVFSIAKTIITMSEGMTELYRSNYGIESEPLEHSYPEQVPKEPNFKRNEKGFWGGEVYAINNKCFERVQDALNELDTQFTVTSLSKLKIKKTPNVFQTFYPTRLEYIEAVSEHGILVLSVNWPDESDINKHELSTIFPTKTVEYLAMGGPILVHCPEHYFLANFFKKYNCGIVVSSREASALKAAIKKLQSKDQEVQQMQRNALRAMEVFSLQRIQKKFELIINNVPL